MAGFIAMCVLTDHARNIRRRFGIEFNFQFKEFIQPVYKSFIATQQVDQPFHILWYQPGILPGIAFTIIINPGMARSARTKSLVPLPLLVFSSEEFGSAVEIVAVIKRAFCK